MWIIEAKRFAEVYSKKGKYLNIVLEEKKVLKICNSKKEAIRFHKKIKDYTDWVIILTSFTYKGQPTKEIKDIIKCVFNGTNVYEKIPKPKTKLKELLI